MNITTIAELDQRMRDYGAAVAKRERWIKAVSFLVLPLTMVIALTCPRLFLASLTGLAAWAVYVSVTSYFWHRRHGVFCPHCTRSLVAIDERLEEISLGASVPDYLACPHCGEVVARQQPDSTKQPTDTAVALPPHSQRANS